MLTPGTRIGPYEVSDQIGIGGMGEVYRATDTNLGRQVAIKVLPDSVAMDTERLARFDREARTLAALNHPNIAAIYGVERSVPSTGSGQGGTTALVMELVEGPTLADRITEGPIHLEEALAICRQIAEALEAAHEQGIVHRDLKPANVKLRPNGTVKVLDFGLAKAIEPAAALSPGLSVSPTITTPALTQAGLILGTAAYMSPEQAKGRRVDKRTDIWSFGVVLYESITGRRPFDAETVPETLAAVMKDEVAFDRLPERVRPLVRRCLEKDPAKRLRDIGDAWALLEASAIRTAAVSMGGTSNWLWQGAAALLAIGLAVTLWAPWRAAPTDRAPVRFQIPFPESRIVQNFAISPDGRTLVMQVRTIEGLRLWVRTLDSLEARELPGTESNANPPFWSADSRWVAFVSTDSKLKKIDVNGGSPLTICDSCGTAIGGSWSADGVILFAGANGVMKVSASGGVPAVVVDAPKSRSGRSGLVAFPTLLPDGRHFVYARSAEDGTAVFRGTLDRAPSDQESIPLVQGVGNRSSGSIAIGFAPAMDSTPGRLLFFRGTTLMAQVLDEPSGELDGEALPVAEGVRFFWTARDTLVYESGGAGTARLTWVDQGKPAGTVGDPDVYTAIALSPDARRAAIVKRGGIGSDLWLTDLQTARSERLTFTGTVANSQPIWSRDAQSIVFSDFGERRTRIFRTTVNSGTEAELLYTTPNSGYVTSISTDGRFVLHMVFDGKTRDIGLVSLDGKVENRQGTRLVATPFDETDGRFSPDGRWVAYKSNETGRTEIYARSFLPGSEGRAPSLGARFPVSKGEIITLVPGAGLTWRADSKALFYVTPKGLMVSELTTDRVSAFGDPKLVLPIAFQGALAGDITPDGLRALVAVPVTEGGSGITAVVNWQSSLPN